MPHTALGAGGVAVGQADQAFSLMGFTLWWKETENVCQSEQIFNMLLDAGWEAQNSDWEWGFPMPAHFPGTPILEGNQSGTSESI